jgi:hypothetical protein
MRVVHPAPRGLLKSLLCVGFLIALVGCPDPFPPEPDGGVPPRFDAGTPDASIPEPDAGTPDAGEPDAGRPDAGEPDAGTPDAGPGPDDGSGINCPGKTASDALPPEGLRLRVVAANLTSGNASSYDLGHGGRILQGLRPDVVLIQEFNAGARNSPAMRDFIDGVFGASFCFYREAGPARAIPNGVVSRFPIVEAGEWDDSSVGDRDFAWARIDLPGTRDLWAVSVHLLTRNSSVRNVEASELVSYVKSKIPAGDFLVIGGDFNTNSRSEPAISRLAEVVSVEEPFPSDLSGDGDTNAGRNSPYDWVLSSPSLTALEVPVRLGSVTAPAGLVFDTRDFDPISAAAPALRDDSAAPSMQHMAVVRDFELKAP